MSDFDYNSQSAGAKAGPSDIGEDLYNVASPSGGGGGLKRTVEKAPAKLGYHKPIHDDRLFKTYDRVAALAKKPVVWDVSRDDRLSPDEAGNRMAALVKLFGLLGEDPAILEAFHRAVFYSHTVNSGSTLQPGRAVMMIAGTEFQYSKVVEFLGNDLRRFFRAFADHIKANNERILQNADPHDVIGQEQRAMILQVAHNRGLVRYPALCHDSADACNWLTDAERAALVSSKAMIFAVGENVADRNRSRPGGSANTAAGSMMVTPTAQAQALAAS